jgi:hypothetical protein
VVRTECFLLLFSLLEKNPLYELNMYVHSVSDLQLVMEKISPFTPGGVIHGR